MSCPLSSLNLELESCFFSLASASASVSNVPLSSRSFATSAIVVGFLGVTPSSSPNEI
jgi:hypothetical protein